VDAVGREGAEVVEDVGDVSEQVVAHDREGASTWSVLGGGTSGCNGWAERADAPAHVLVAECSGESRDAMSVDGERPDVERGREVKGEHGDPLVSAPAGSGDMFYGPQECRVAQARGIVARGTITPEAAAQVRDDEVVDWSTAASASVTEGDPQVDGPGDRRGQGAG
jgi:hypothetical protein